MTIFLLRLLFSFCVDLEDVSNTRDSVSAAIQTPRISSKIHRCASYFQLSFRCLDIQMKHSLVFDILLLGLSHCLARITWENLESVCYPGHNRLYPCASLSTKHHKRSWSGEGYFREFWIGVCRKGP